MQLISVTSSRLNLSTPRICPTFSFCWFSQRRVPHRYQQNQSHYVSTAHGSAQRSIWRQSKMTCTFPCNLKNHLSRKSSGLSSGYRTWFAYSGRGIYSPWTDRLDSNVVSWTFGRIGMCVLKERQYQSPPVRSSLDEHDVQQLQFCPL